MERLSYTVTYSGYGMSVRWNRSPSKRVCEALHNNGFRYDHRTRCWCGSAYRKEQVIALCDTAVVRSCKGGKKKETLCVSCDHADKGMLSRCPWAAEFRPVKGWNAIKTQRSVDEDHKVKGKDFDVSYCVIECPLYIKTVRKKKQTRR